MEHQRQCTLAAVHDAREDHAKRFADAGDLKFWTSDFKAMLGYGVDFVVLAGPLAERLEQVQLAAEQGLPVLLHTPAAPDLPTMQAMTAIAAEHETRIGVYTRHHADPVIEQLRRMIAADWIGGVTTVQSIVGDDELLRTRSTAEQVDPFIDLASAHVHLATSLIGRRAQSVTAQATRAFLTDANDSGVATVVLRGNVSCTFSATRLARADAFAIHGTDGGVRMAGDRIWLRGHRPFRGHVFDYKTPGVEQVLARRDIESTLAAHRTKCELHGRFARWLEDTDDYPVPGEQAVVDFEILDAMTRAAALGVRVEL